MRCPDPPVHPPAGSALAGPLRALAVVVVLAVCVWAADALVSLWAALLAAEGALAAAMVWVLVRLVRYGGWRKPRPAAAGYAHSDTPMRKPAALPAAPLAIERYGASPGEASAVTVVAGKVEA